MPDKNRNNKGWLSGLRDIFASVKLTVALLLALAAVAIIGTLIPQNQPHIFYITKYKETAARLIFLLQMDNMYHSPWFRALVTMLAANILVCSITRLKTVFKIVFLKKPSFSVKNFERNTVETFPTEKTPEVLQKGCNDLLLKKFHTTQLEQADKGFRVFAERGRITRLGVYLVHFAVLLLLCGTLISSISGFEGYVQIPEGQAVNSVQLRDSDKTMPLGFAIRCDDFEVSFYKSGRPKEYRSTLSIIEDGKVKLTKDIVVNRPLRYKGFNIFQSSYGTSVKDVDMVFTSKKSGLSYHRKMHIGDTIQIPENLGSFKLTDFVESYRFMGQHNIGPSLVGIIARDKEKPQMVVLPIQFPSFDKMRRGKVTIAAEHFSKAMYTGLQVTKDPGVPVVYASFILIILGIYIAFFTSHQKFCVMAVRIDGRTTTVTVSATANKNRPAARKTAQQLAKKLKRL